MESKFEWIHDLIRTEAEMEESGLVDVSFTVEPERAMIGAALTFLGELKNEFHDAIEVFNEMKHHSAGKIKLYGIAKTPADFMLFRNGIKLIFSLKQPGIISVRTHFTNPALPVVTSMNLIGSTVAQPVTSPQFRSEESLLELKWGPFEEVIWTYKSQPIKIDSVVKHYLTQFIRDTTATL